MVLQVALRPEITPESVISIEFIEKSEPPQVEMEISTLISNLR